MKWHARIGMHVEALDTMHRRLAVGVIEMRTRHDVYSDASAIW